MKDRTKETLTIAGWAFGTFAVFVVAIYFGVIAISYISGSLTIKVKSINNHYKTQCVKLHLCKKKEDF